ncbi:MAG: L,D-transpeptidase [Actinobacteria bacterium]|nr:L,D-transpeptidase [Actinomycetota bacterium]
MFKYLKKWIGLIITVILVFLILVFVGKMIIFPAGNLEAAQKQSETTKADNMNNPLASNNEDFNEADFIEPGDTDYSDEVTVEGISEGDGSMDNLAGESGEDKDIIKKEAGEVQEVAVVEEIKDENNNPGPIEEQDIDFTSSDDFRIKVDLTKQKVFVYYKDNLIKEMICSGGADQFQTPLGEFKTSQKIEYSWIDRFNMGAYYWTRFYKKYLFHSVPFDENKEMIMEEYEKLGSPASHGCIRLKLEEAKWLYEKLPLGVTVLIHE